MEPNKEARIEELLGRYWEGETSLEEERELHAFFAQDHVPDHLTRHREQFRFFRHLREERLPQLPHPNRLFDKIDEQATIGQQPSRRFNGFHWGFGVAASILFMVFGFWVGSRYQNQQLASAPPSEVEALRREVQEMKEMLLATQRQPATASERIMAVSQEFEIAEPDADIIQTLISALNFDPSVNVRQAACEALFRFKEQPQVRKALIESLKVQKNPNLQLTLIDMLVEMKEKQAVPEMNRLIKDQEALDIVKLKAQEGVGMLL